MTIDRYTKAVLTVIAACLLWLCAKPVFEPARVSADDAQNVRIVGWKDSSNGAHFLPPSSDSPYGDAIPVKSQK